MTCQLFRRSIDGMNSAERWLTAKEERLWRRWLTLNARLSATLHRELQDDAGLSMPDFEVLVHLTDSPQGRVRVFSKALAEIAKFSNERLLLAVSGGADSVVLCELSHQGGYDFIIAHCNFQLRGEESEGDEKFVLALGQKYNKEVLVQRFDTEEFAKKNKLSIQEAARELRYQWFEELLKEGKARHTVTAHHADDNIETLLMNFFRGTGVHGLTGIPERSSIANTIRPLLNFRKSELLDFAKQNNLSWVEDSSNASIKYTRNFFRNELLPALQKSFPQVEHNLLGNINRFKDADALYQLAIGSIKKKLCKAKGNEIHIPVKQLMEFKNGAVILEIIRDFGFTKAQIDEVIKLASAESGSFIQSPNAPFQIIRHRHWFIIAPLNAEQAEHFIIEEKTKHIDFPGGKLQLNLAAYSENGESKIPGSNQVAMLDAKEIRFPILLRKWKAGDYFYPLGMKKKKKLARFFIDQKLSKTDKEKVWVLEMDQKIIWVIGHRIDERFKLKSSTRKILNIAIR